MQKSPQKIVIYPDPILKKKSRPIARPKSPDIKKLIKKMLLVMQANNGMGLAAPQIGESFRLFVARVENKNYVFINPAITSFSKKTVILEEGCLSFPGQFLIIERPNKITVKGLDKTGKKMKIQAKGLLARTIQHEVDHLNGILLPDKKRNKKILELNQ